MVPEDNPEDIVIYIGTDDLTNEENLLIWSFSNISKTTNNILSPKISRQNRRNIEKSLLDTNKKPLSANRNQFH